MKRLFFLILILIFFVAGCSLKKGVPQWSGSGFLRSEFLEYQNIAIVPFEGDDSGEVTAAFTMSFQERFPRISIVDRKRVRDAFREIAFPVERLDNGTRAKIGETLAAQAFVSGSVYYPSILRWYLQVMIVDAGTGKVMGRSVVEIDFMGAEGTREGARFAVEKLVLW